MSATTTVKRFRIAIAGATGRIGATLMAGLATEPVDLIALTRKPDPQRFPAEVSQHAVDFEKASTLRAGLQDIDRLFLAQGTSPRQVENEIALIDAAVAAGVKHIVKLSAFGTPLQLHPFDWHTRIEVHLATRDIGYGLLRPSTFRDILTRAGRLVADDSWGGAAGAGIVNLIDARDVADAAKTVLLEQGSTDWQRAFHLTGARAWSMPEVAAELSRLLGREVVYHHRSPDEERQYLLASGQNEFSAGVRVGLDRAVYQSALQETTSTVQLLTGHAPRTLSDWLQERLPLFQKQPDA